MNLIGISINHHTAPVELRESVFLSNDEIKSFLIELNKTIFSESFIISTCNRTEIYGLPSDVNVNYHDIEKFLLDRKTVKEISDEHFQKFVSNDALNHLFSVASGIDSQLIGDNQIFGQVKEAFQIAEENQNIGFLLRRIFDTAIQVGKRAKTETAINDGAITVSYAAVQLIEKIFSNLNKKSALVIGMGKTGEIAARHLKDKKIGKLAVTNRTYERVEKITEELNARIIPFNHFKESLDQFDIIISSTSAPDYMLTKDDVKQMMKKRSHTATVFMDIAVPRDIDPQIRSIDNVFYNDIDSLNIIVEQNLERRKDEIPKVQNIIMEESKNFFNWYNSLEITPTIKILRDYFEAIRNDEVKKQINKFNAEDREKVEILTKKIINKILHQPMVELKKSAEQGTDSPDTISKIALIRDIFGVDKTNGREEEPD